MDAGPDDVRRSANLGPISPELVLVDPVLAEYARQLLPEPSERPRPRAPVTALESAVAFPEPPSPAVAAATPAPRRRWRRMVVLATLVFVAGAISGTFLGGKDPTSGGVTFEAQAEMPNAGASSAVEPTSQSTTTSSAREQTSRPPKASPRAALQPPHRPAQDVRAWASNVLGVEARVEEPGVALVWQRPRDSGHVVVLRARGARGSGVVVFRGRTGRYRDTSARPCSAYRYTIVNYDRRGQRSTGVPTSVVTAGCT